MYNENNTKNVLKLTPIGTPTVRSVIENEIGGLSAQTDNLESIVNDLFARLTPLLRSPNCKESETPDQMEVTPLAQQIRANKLKVANSVESLKDLLDRLDL